MPSKKRAARSISMPGDRILLDTNALIAWMREDDALRIRAGDSAPAVSLFTLGEMYFGIQKSLRPDENEKALVRALQDFEMLLPDAETARRYGAVFAELRRKGRPIPVNDIWIAAIALQHGLKLLARDAHFKEISGLTAITW